MNPKIEHWEKELNAITAQFKTTFGHLSPENLNYKLDAKTWSIAEIIIHLIKINESYYPVIKAVRNGTQQLPFISKFPFFPKMLGNYILKSVSPDRKNKVKTFPIWKPDASYVSGNILEEFEKHQREFINFMKGTEGLLNKGTIISSPANNLIVYKLETAFKIIVSHEKRHLNQAREVLKQLQ